MTKYQALIKKVQDWKKDPFYFTYNISFSQSELELIADALETMQFLEIVLKARTENLEKKPTNHD